MKRFINQFSLTVILTILLTNLTQGQVSENSELFKTLKSKDSLLFERSFNKCETKWLQTLVDEDFEFYHDQSGITNSKDAFINIMNNGICNPNNETKSRRVLVPGSLKVYPLMNNGKLYGAIQMGTHRFFERYKTQPETAGSIAQFSHLWILKENTWYVKRVLSYDHKMPKKHN